MMSRILAGVLILATMTAFVPTASAVETCQTHDDANYYEKRCVVYQESTTDICISYYYYDPKDGSDPTETCAHWIRT